jgi:hypothetical protein
VVRYAEPIRWRAPVQKAKTRERHEQHYLHNYRDPVLSALGKCRRHQVLQTAHHHYLTDQETIRVIADAPTSSRTASA